MIVTAYLIFRKTGYKRWMSTCPSKPTIATPLARKHYLTNHLRQKEIYSKKSTWEVLQERRFVWLNSPLSCGGASITHGLPIQSCKKMSDCNYRIKKLQGRRDRKVVCLDQLNYVLRTHNNQP